MFPFFLELSLVPAASTKVTFAIFDAWCRTGKNDHENVVLVIKPLHNVPLFFLFVRDTVPFFSLKLLMTNIWLHIQEV